MTETFVKLFVLIMMCIITFLFYYLRKIKYEDFELIKFSYRVVLTMAALWFIWSW